MMTRPARALSQPAREKRLSRNCGALVIASAKVDEKLKDSVRLARAKKLPKAAVFLLTLGPWRASNTGMQKQGNNHHGRPPAAMFEYAIGRAYSSGILAWGERPRCRWTPTRIEVSGRRGSRLICLLPPWLLASRRQQAAAPANQAAKAA